MTTTRSNLRLGLMFFTPLLAWGIQLLAGYGLAALACTTTKLPFFILSGVAVGATVAAGVLSFVSAHERINVRDLEHADAPEEFVAACGVLLAVVFFVLIATTGIYGAFLNPCSSLNMALP